MSNNIKILASDFDGTLNYNGSISAKDLDAISRFRRAGNKFGVVTGRGSDMISRICELPLDFIICATGALIIGENMEVIYKKNGVFGDFIRPIFEYATELGCGYFSYSLNGARYDIKLNDDLDGKEFEQCSSVFDTAETAMKFANFVNSNYSDRISAFVNEIYLDMPPAGASKVNGIEKYAKSFSDPIIYTVGDNTNDIEMIKAFNGIAVSNAKAELKAVASHKADRVCDAIEYIMKN